MHCSGKCESQICPEVFLRYTYLYFFKPLSTLFLFVFFSLPFLSVLFSLFLLYFLFCSLFGFSSFFFDFFLKSRSFFCYRISFFPLSRFLLFSCLFSYFNLLPGVSFNKHFILLHSLLYFFHLFQFFINQVFPSSSPLQFSCVTSLSVVFSLSSFFLFYSLSTRCFLRDR